MSRARLILPIAFLAAGCGGGSTGAGGGDPASVVPAEAAVYVEASVRPEGSVRDGAVAASTKLLGERDPGRRLRELLERSAREEGVELSYQEDVAPWLGERAGVFLTSLGGEEPEAAAVLSVTDEDAATDALEKATAQRPTVERTYRDVSYRLDRKDGSAAGLVDGYVVLGDEPLLRRAIDAVEGDALSEADRYEELVGDLPEERLGSFYLDLRAILGQALARADRAGAAEALGPLRAVLDPADAGPVAGALVADGDRVAVETLAAAGSAELLGRLSGLAGGGEVALVGELPADSWLAFATPDVGGTARELYRSAAGIFGETVTEQLELDTGINLERDVFSWMGDAGVFVRGTSLEALSGALVIEATDERKAREAIGRLLGLARARVSGLRSSTISIPGADQAVQLGGSELPASIILALGNGRVVLAYGRAAARDGLRASSQLADATAFARARERLGDDLSPSFVLSLPQALALAESSGASSDPEFAEARKYLDAIDVVTSGGEKDDDRTRSRLAVGLR